MTAPLAQGITSSDCNLRAVLKCLNSNISAWYLYIPIDYTFAQCY